VLNLPHEISATLDVTKMTASGSVDAILDEVSSINYSILEGRFMTSGGSLSVGNVLNHKMKNSGLPLTTCGEPRPHRIRIKKF